jgi:general secretion pathway protein F
METQLKEYEKDLGKTTIVFLKLGLEKGNIKEAISSLVEILSQDMQINKKLKDTLRYPFLLFSSLLIAFSIIFIYVLPNFESILVSFGSNLPSSTKALLGLKDFIFSYHIWIGIFFISIVFLLFVLYKSNRYYFHKLLLNRLWLLSKVIKSYLFYKLFLSIYIIVKSKYQFQIAIKHSYDITSNLYLKSIIKTIVSKIKKGKQITKSFEDTGFFDELTIALLYSAEHSNSYEEVLKDITTYHKKSFSESVDRFIAIINPLIIVIMGLLILWIVLAVMEPTWSLSTHL